MTALPEYAVSYVKQIAKQQGFIDFTIETKPGSNHGDNFLGVLTAVALIGKREVDGKQVDHRLDLLCKTASTNAHTREQLHSDLVFTSEAFAYNKLLPTFLEFQKEKGLLEHECFTSFPNCYLATCNPEKEEYLVIMDDLRPEGFKMWPKTESLPIDHCRLVIQELAKLHAVSYALRDQKPEVFDEFKNLRDSLQKLLNITNNHMKEHFDRMYDQVIGSLKSDEHKAILEHIKGNMVKYSDDIFNIDAHKEIGVVCHGDCWNNNFIFKYSNDIEKETLQQICLLDWQLIRYTSPAIDFLHAIFLSTDKKLRNEDYENLKHFYFSTLTNQIKKLGSDAGKLIGFAEFEEQLKRFGNFVLYFAPLVVPFLHVKPEDLGHMDEISEKLANGEEAGDFVKGFDEETQKLLDDRLNGIVGDIVEFGYYRKV